MTKTEMRRAAAVLRREAAAMKKTCAVGCAWDDPGNEADHEEMVELARELEIHARTLPHAKVAGNR